MIKPKTKTIILCGVLLILVVSRAAEYWHNTHIELELQSKKMSFGVGQSKDEVFGTMEKNGFHSITALEDKYRRNTPDLKLYAVCDEYVFVFYNDELVRIENRGDGAGVVLPRNYYQ